MRTASGVQFLSADPQGSAEIAIDATTQTEAQRHFTPFGQFRGSPTSVWPNDKGFVGGTIDLDGLTHLGAREYDPDSGRFISVDPLFDPKDPQSWNGYAYSDNNPPNASDPSGQNACVNEPGGAGAGCRWKDKSGNDHNATGVVPKGSSSSGGCIDPTCSTTNMGRNDSNGVAIPRVVQISPHVAIASNDPSLSTLQQYWQWANRKFGDLDEAAKWRQICEGGDSPCNYRLKLLFLEHDGQDWLTPTVGHGMLSSGLDIVIAGRGLFAFRMPNVDHPPNKDVAKAMGESPIDICNYDCGEIAQDLYIASGGEGEIIRFEGPEGETGTINVPEAGGSNIVEYTFHEVYMDGQYAYDPRLRSTPIPRGDYGRALRGLNPEGLKTTVVDPPFVP